MLSPKLLEALREYWRRLRRKPKEWLFPGGPWHTANHPITPKVVWNACQKAAQRAGLQNRVHPHTLRQKPMTLSLDEFLRHFLLHVLPKGFVRIRHFGSSPTAGAPLFCRFAFKLLGAAQPSQTEPAASPAQQPSPIWLCPKCGGRMMVIERLTAPQIQLRSPPSLAGVAA